MHSEHREPLIRISKRQGMPFWRALGIRLMPMPVTIDGAEYIENVNLTYGDFFARLAGGARRDADQIEIGKDEGVFIPKL